MLRSRRLLISILVTALLIATGCGVSSDEPATTDTSRIAFGRGSIPETVPDSFPIPDQAVVGATLVDPGRDLTEMILTFPTDVPVLVTYYEENMPSSGYEITSSDGSETEWRIAFTGEGVDGVIRVKSGGSGVAAVTVELTDR